MADGSHGRHGYYGSHGVTEAMADTDTTAVTAAKIVKASHRSYGTTISRYVIYETGNI